MKLKKLSKVEYMQMLNYEDPGPDFPVKTVSCFGSRSYTCGGYCCDLTVNLNPDEIKQ